MVEKSTLLRRFDKMEVERDQRQVKRSQESGVPHTNKSFRNNKKKRAKADDRGSRKYNQLKIQFFFKKN